MNNEDMELLKEATQFGYVGLFAHRDTPQIAYDYAMEIVKSYGDDGAQMLTGVQVLLNTMAINSAKQARVMVQLVELAEATKSYCEDDSRSARRRLAMIEGADKAIEAAAPHV